VSVVSTELDTLVSFAKRHAVIHLPEPEREPVVAKPRKKITERPACSCCGSADRTVRAVTRQELSDDAAPWLTHLCAKCGKRLLRKTTSHY
jgi:hypothetical protein